MKIKVLSLLFFLVGTVHAEDWFLHPKALEKALGSCATSSSQTVDCDELQSVAIQLQASASQFQRNPQSFGIKILHLQEELAALKMDSKNVSNRAEIKEKNRRLQEYLAIISWLSSPGN